MSRADLACIAPMKAGEEMLPPKGFKPLDVLQGQSRQYSL
jgi:hypothetical protein